MKNKALLVASILTIVTASITMLLGLLMLPFSSALVDYVLSEAAQTGSSLTNQEETFIRLVMSIFGWITIALGGWKLA